MYLYDTCFGLQFYYYFAIGTKNRLIYMDRLAAIVYHAFCWQRANKSFASRPLFANSLFCVFSHLPLSHLLQSFPGKRRAKRRVDRFHRGFTFSLVAMQTILIRPLLRKKQTNIFACLVCEAKTFHQFSDLIHSS